MRKILAIAICFLLTVGSVGCSSNDEKEVYKPKEVAQYNMVYRTTTNREEDGQYPVINISNVYKEEDDIIIDIAAPTLKQITYSFDKFMYVRLMDEYGEELELDKIHLLPIESDIEAKLKITGIDLEKVKWVELGPYKTNENNNLIFERK